MPLVMCVVDILMSPYRRIDLAKGYQPFLAGIVYLVFSLLFELAGATNAKGEDGKNIYLRRYDERSKSLGRNLRVLQSIFLSRAYKLT